jgi:serine/threonine protein kinase
MKINPNGFECYGVTRDPNTNKYLIVSDFYEEGDLRRYFRYEACNLNWSKKLDMLLQLARDLQNIHKANLVHKDFHSGNVLVDDIACIADLGQSQSVETTPTSTDEVNGVMPYVAPEVLCKRPYTKAADVYSFGIIMWEFTSFQLPFPERAHDIDLVFSICDGLRPNLIEGTPPCYVELMQQCWDSDPKKRPTAEYIANKLQNWTEGSDENIVNQFKTSDEFNSANPVRERPQQFHKSAFYTSRLLPTVPIAVNSMFLELYIVNNCFYVQS